MTEGPGITVRGGVGGTAVGVDELVAAAGHLMEAATELGGVVAGLMAATAEVAASAPLSPVTALRAEVELARAAQLVAVEEAAAAGVATAVRSAAWAYREVEDEVVRTTALAQDVVMAVVGHAAPTLVVGVLALDAVGIDVGLLADRALWEVPELADAAGGSGGLVVGLRSNPVTAPFVAPPHRVGSGPADGAPARGADPDSQAVGVLSDSAAAWGLLRDAGAVRVTAVVGTSGDRPDIDGAGKDGLEDGRVRAPAGLADLARDQAELPGDGRVRVVEVRGELGPAWVVEIGGTQVWDPHAGANPFDLTTDVRSMASESTLLAAGVQQALAAAQCRAASTTPGRDVAAEPVLLSGHSLGGIVAAGLASSAAFRSAHRVSHVVTFGSPVAKMPVPPGVQVLSVEHRQDPVPRLEGRPNPDRAGWVTVSRDLDGTAGPREGASAAHRSERYVKTAAAVDESGDRSLAGWRAGSEVFFPGSDQGSTAVIRDYRIARVIEPP